jgi:hypothetical protein
MRTTIPNITGQWLGHFKYGPEYGELYGESVSFSFILEELSEGQFQGKCYELEGVGCNSDVSVVKGYVDGDNIHFTKEYSTDFQIQEDGTVSKNTLSIKPILTYDGEYNFRTGLYTGQWELEINLGPTINGDLLDICTGTWEMSKV